MATLLLFEDKLGITSGYEPIWQSLLAKAGLHQHRVIRRKSYDALSRVQLLIRKGNRVSPGFNPDLRVQAIIRKWMVKQVEDLNPALCICMDPALLFVANPDWNQATGDNMRGGHYRFQSRPFICILPISAWHNKKKEKDIARLNEGYSDKEEWEEAHGGDEADYDSPGAIWLEPVSVPYGKFVLTSDLMKVGRILEKEVPSV